MTRWITVEGCNGVGKTHVVAELARQLGDRVHVLPELTDLPDTSLAGRVMRALLVSSDQFLRTGAPRAETQLLLALQTHRHEAVPRDRELILEDRGPWSVAVYQSLILHPDDDCAALSTARWILRTNSRWRPEPDVTVLLRDDPVACTGRFATRLGRSITAEEQHLVQRAAALYDVLAAESDRVHVIDRRHRASADLLDDLLRICQLPSPPN
jgi:dTMP kinase